MASSTLLILFISISTNLVVLATAETKQLYHLCSATGNFTINSSYSSNLKTTLSSLTTDTRNTYGFYNSSSGQEGNEVNAIGLCRGDKKPETCRSCIKNSSQHLREQCPNQKEAIIWYDDCMLRYSNRSIFGKMEPVPYVWAYNLNNVSRVDEFHEVLNNLLYNLTSKAVMGDSHRKFATGNAVDANSQTMFALVQCTPDLSGKECGECLNKSIELIPQCCRGRQGGRVVTPSCHFRYEKDIFYDSTITEALPPAPQVPQAFPPSPGNGPTGIGNPGSKAQRVLMDHLHLGVVMLAMLLISICFPI